MQERLVDVLNDKNNVLHVFPVQIEGNDGSVREAAFEQKALQVAKEAEIVPEPEEDKLKARMHVSRGGQLMPYGDSLQVKHDQQMRHEQRVRECAYYLWEQAGCPDNQSDNFWHRACELQSGSDQPGFASAA